MPTKARTATGRYPRGEETKQRIIDVAVEMFGRQGFAGTSTRDIAAAAAVNTPAIQYYFGGKLGLYGSGIDQLTDRIWGRIAPAMDACRATVDAGGSLSAVISALSEVQDRLIDSFFAEQEGPVIRRLLAWEDAENENSPSGQCLKERIGLPIFATFQDAVKSIVPAPMHHLELELHALSLIGISMIFHFNQCRVMDMLNWSTLDETMVAALKDVARKQLTYALLGLSRPANADGGSGR